MSKIGRPRLPGFARKARILSVRLTVQERRAVQSAAKRAGEAVPAWLRRVILAAAALLPACVTVSSQREAALRYAEGAHGCPGATIQTVVAEDRANWRWHYWIKVCGKRRYIAADMSTQEEFHDRTGELGPEARPDWKDAPAGPAPN